MTFKAVRDVLLSVRNDENGIASLEYALLAIGILTGLATAIAAVAKVLDPLYSTTIVGLL